MPDSVPSPRLAATLLLLRDDPFEVLMVRRNARGTFASALVFPGGAIDDADRDPAWVNLVEDFEDFSETERALRIGVIRETWEETSVLLGGGGQAAATGPGGFREAVVSSGRRLALADVVPFSHWVTPTAEARRFDTHFFLAAAPELSSAVSDGLETVGLEWVNPAEAVRLARAGERPIIFPTLMNLTRLAESTTVVEALNAARARPSQTVQPTIETHPDGSRTITIPEDAGYGLTEFTVLA